MNKLPAIVKQIQNHKPQEINYAFHKTISYSQLSMYLQCPKRWALQYRDGHKIPSFSINMTFGTALHETLQNYLNVMYTESGTKADEINIEEYFEDRFRENYSKGYKDNNNIHFSNSEEMREFYEDGLAILDFIKKKRQEYFSIKGWHLVGIEVPIVISPDKRYNNVLFNGFVDLILYHEPTEQFVIYDIKTSTRGWGDREKKDEIKLAQILLYKHYFSKQFNLLNETKKEKVSCSKCDHSWDIEKKDEYPYLCHMCGYDSKSKKHNYEELENFWKNYKKEEVNEKWSEKYNTDK